MSTIQNNNNNNKNRSRKSNQNIFKLPTKIKHQLTSYMSTSQSNNNNKTDQVSITKIYSNYKQK